MIIKTSALILSYWVTTGVFCLRALPRFEAIAPKPKVNEHRFLTCVRSWKRTGLFTARYFPLRSYAQRKIQNCDRAQASGCRAS